MAYTTWQKVLDIFPQAADVESVGANQTALITAKSDLFHSFIRGVHKADLTGSDEAVKLAVASLVADELMRRRLEDDSDLMEITYSHYNGMVTRFGADAHALINGILKSAIILDEQHSEHDVQGPEAVPTSGNTSTGKVFAYLPHEYKGQTIDTFTIKITTGGRIDAATTIFAFYKNMNATAIGSGVTATTSPILLVDELYIYFQDVALTGASFVANDTWTITAIPPDRAGRSMSPRNIEFYSG